MEKKLSVENLSISFRTSGGKVQAVRNVNFDLYEGETLCIVGESGSGKSVTSRAILGILAPNAIKENGQILYDGQDLMKITEDDFHKIRGDKIAMIFQDPMSSLNPIVKVGKQLTEAMILKGKANQRNSKKTLSVTLRNLEHYMQIAYPDQENEIHAGIESWKKQEYAGIALLNKYNIAQEAATEAVEEIDNFLFEIEKSAVKNGAQTVKEIYTLAKRSMHPDVVSSDFFPETIERFKNIAKKAHQSKEADAYAALTDVLKEMRSECDEGAKKVPVSYFSAAFYLAHSGKEVLPEMPTEELNAYLDAYREENFLADFRIKVKNAILASFNESIQKKQQVVDMLTDLLPRFTQGELDPKVIYPEAKKAIDAVLDSIDHLAIIKDSNAYTFKGALNAALETYFDATSRNEKEQARFNKQQAKHDKIVASGKEPNWSVVPLNLTDKEAIQDDIRAVFNRVIDFYQEILAQKDSIDWDDMTEKYFAYVSKNATGVVHRVTKRMAKSRALKLMDEVGIPESRKRYNQYPFEFSGGMRQRVVIAIALSADPDILICDEPTTALDVTIQSQILELINRIKEERKLSVIFITHDLGVVANMADRVAVMYAGKIVEMGTANDIFYSPAHPYTWALLSSMPDLDTKEKLEAIPGTPPNMIYPPVGDAFAARNKYAMAIDFKAQPPMFKISETHSAATWLLHPNAPKIEMPKAVRDRIERMKNR